MFATEGLLVGMSGWGWTGTAVSAALGVSFFIRDMEGAG
jgi:hypothetical protein